MTRLRRRLTLPPHWTTIRGLWLAEGGLHGAVFDEDSERILLYEGVRIVTAATVGWTVREVVACLASYDTPRGVEPSLSFLTGADLEPLVDCGALTLIDRLRLLAHVPGWRP